MVKKIFALLLAVCMLIGTVPVVAYASQAEVTSQVMVDNVDTKNDNNSSVNTFFVSIYYRLVNLWNKITSIFNSIFRHTQKVTKVETVRTDKKIEPIVNPSESSLFPTSLYAYRIKNKVQSSYTDTGRNGIRFENMNAVLTHTLTDVKKSATLADVNGNIYIKNSFRTYYVDKSGYVNYFENSGVNGRVNNIRLGEYYYDCHVRDFDINGFKVDKNYHVYSDRLYQQYSLYSSVATTAVREFGSEVEIPVKTVDKIQVKDKNGIHDTVKDIDEQSVEYVAFDIKDAGVVGFIIPSDGSTRCVKVTENKNSYIIAQVAEFEPFDGINKFDETGGYELNYVTFGSRIYTDSTHSFEGVSTTSEEERNPLTDIKIGPNNSNAKYLEYDALRGAYTFKMNGMDFQFAYDNPEKQLNMPVTINGDDIDREIFVRSFGASGCLEAAALLDDNKLLAPVDVEVCKNFQGDGGEGFYSVKDYQYGDSIFPVKVNSSKSISFTLLNLYQNWGKFPLKQISSIEFHTAYYHLSTGTTESNCIAPYFVFGKDGWTLPDFRNRSGNMWATQPQFNSEGILKFAAQKNQLSEFRGSVIDSCGQTYSDVTDYYVSDDGKFDYSVRHVEFPQTDENRTYYTFKLKFNEDTSIKNFKETFDLFYFDGRFVKFNKMGYLDKDNQFASSDVNTSKGNKYYTLGNNCPYYGFYDITDDTEHCIDEGNGCNFALIVKSSKITVNGKDSDVRFAVRDSSTDKITTGCLTLDAEKISFKKGDVIEIDMILLPWGVGTEENDNNVRAVREDSALNPVKVTAKTGVVKTDTFLPVVKAEDNFAEFTLVGGKNNNAVRVDGITSLNCAPSVYKLVGSEWQKVELASTNGYDGYSVRIGDDGTYSVSFVYETANPYEENTFRIVCE